jgi:hypothetical protein
LTLEKKLLGKYSEVKVEVVDTKHEKSIIRDNILRANSTYTRHH